MKKGMRQFSAETVMRLIEELSKLSTTHGGFACLFVEINHWYDRKGGPAISSARSVDKGCRQAAFSLPATRAGIPVEVTEVSPPEGLDALARMRLGLLDFGEFHLAVADGHRQRRSGVR